MKNEKDMPRFNIKIVFYILGAIALCLYIIYNVIPTGSDLPIYQSYASADSWKRGHPIVPLSVSLWENEKHIIVTEKTVNLSHGHIKVKAYAYVYQ